MILGALNDSINMHGPIQKDMLNSVLKRIIGAFKTFCNTELHKARVARNEAKKLYPKVGFDIYLLDNQYVLVPSEPIKQGRIKGIEVL
jgi:hypothetical protein